MLPHVTIVDLQEKLVDHLKVAFAKSGRVKVINDDWQAALPTDAVVSPANGFGLMDGGFDLVLTEYFGPDLQVRVRQKLREDYAGEQPVGTAFTVHTGRRECKWCIHAPTMRYPSDVNGTLNAYYAMKAILIEAVKQEFDDIVMTGLATFYGNLDFSTAAVQMAAAYEHVRIALSNSDVLNPTDDNHLLWPQAKQRDDVLRHLQVNWTARV